MIPRFWKPVKKFSTMSAAKKATTNQTQYVGIVAPEKAWENGTKNVSIPMMRRQRKSQDMRAMLSGETMHEGIAIVRCPIRNVPISGIASKSIRSQSGPSLRSDELKIFSSERTFTFACCSRGCWSICEPARLRVTLVVFLGRNLSWAYV